MNKLRPINLHPCNKHARVKPGSGLALEPILSCNQLSQLVIKYYTPVMEDMKHEVEQEMENRRRKRRVHVYA